jgi:hypothetical protein
VFELCAAFATLAFYLIFVVSLIISFSKKFDRFQESEEDETPDVGPFFQGIDLKRRSKCVSVLTACREIIRPILLAMLLVFLSDLPQM